MGHMIRPVQFALTGMSKSGNSIQMFQVTRSGAWLPDGRLYKSLRIGLVSLCVCSGPQQTRLFVSEFTTSGGNSNRGAWPEKPVLSSWLHV